MLLLETATRIPNSERHIRTLSVDNCSVKEEQSVLVTLHKEEKIDRNLAGNEMCPTEHTDFIILKIFF